MWVTPSGKIGSWICGIGSDPFGSENFQAQRTGALNPVAAHIMGGNILSAVNRRFAIRPFVTVVRLDYESWSFLCRKHFGL